MTMTETVEVEGKLVVGFGIKKSGNPISEAKGRCVKLLKQIFDQELSKDLQEIKPFDTITVTVTVERQK